MAFGYHPSSGVGCVFGTSYCYICPRFDTGAPGSIIDKLDTGALGYDGEFVTMSGLSEEIHHLVVNQPIFIITASISGRYTLMDSTFPAVGLITSSGSITMAGTIEVTTAS